MGEEGRTRVDKGGQGDVVYVHRFS